jgi:hypothetical protein
MIYTHFFCQDCFRDTADSTGKHVCLSNVHLLKNSTAYRAVCEQLPNLEHVMLRSLDPAECLCFFINVYNLLTMHACVELFSSEHYHAAAAKLRDPSQPHMHAANQKGGKRARANSQGEQAAGKSNAAEYGPIRPIPTRFSPAAGSGGYHQIDREPALADTTTLEKGPTTETIDHTQASNWVEERARLMRDMARFQTFAGIKTHKYHLVSYKSTFVGAEAVTFMVHRTHRF